ncbi:hypothetical protein ABZX92_12550 [Lentzea sp. NPDC006480]|uniref:hypothetical protein n=1 Tax=Lentzea sp. NPDC006480 TaxID=3157176 RepID=UPI0033B9D32D
MTHVSQPKRTVRVVVALTLAEASVLARAAVVVTSALDCKEVNAGDEGLRVFRAAVAQALSNYAEATESRRLAG